MSWAELKTAVRRAWWKLCDAAGALVCKARGKCRYDTYCFQTNVLYFCVRCSKEMFNRTFDDIEPLSEEDHEWLLREQDMRREAA